MRGPKRARCLKACGWSQLLGEGSHEQLWSSVFHIHCRTLLLTRSMHCVLDKDRFREDRSKRHRPPTIWTDKCPTIRIENLRLSAHHRAVAPPWAQGQLQAGATGPTGSGIAGTQETKAPSPLGPQERSTLAGGAAEPGLELGPHLRSDRTGSDFADPDLNG